MATSDTDTITPPTAVLTHADRCDRCCAQATTIVVFVVGELLFCSHHARQYEQGYASDAIQVLTGLPS